MTMTADAEFTATREVAIGSFEQIPLGEGREFRVGDVTVAVFRARNGKIFATQPECPHRAGPLADGLLGGNTLICPFHNWRFDLTNGLESLGNCTLKTYPVRIDADGMIYLAI